MYDYSEIILLVNVCTFTFTLYNIHVGDITLQQIFACMYK